MKYNEFVTFRDDLSHRLHVSGLSVSFCVRLKFLPLSALEPVTFFESKLTNERHCIGVAREPGHFINLFVHFPLNVKLMNYSAKDVQNSNESTKYRQTVKRKRGMLRASPTVN